MTLPTILIVDDDPGAIQLLARVLSDTARVRFAISGQAALALAAANPPDLILLDAEMPGMSGFQVCAALKKNPATATIPVIFVTSHSQPEFELSGLELGAVDFISKPISEPLVRARVRTQLRVKQLHDELVQLATVDPLTRLANRRHFDTALALEWARGMRAGDPISMLMVDVDHFKLYNDHYGHPAGDAALQSVALALGSVCQRPADLVARYGGEEFVILLPQTPRAGAALLAQRALEAVAALGSPHAASPTAPHVTVSVGAGCFDSDSAHWIGRPADTSFLREFGTPCSALELTTAADKALYVAKRAGRACARLLDISDVDIPDVDAPMPAPDNRPSPPRRARDST